MLLLGHTPVLLSAPEHTALGWRVERCHGVTDDGTCISSPTPTLQHGGCFDLREIGQSCVAAEQSVCLGGSGCFHFGDSTLSKCFQTCDGGASCSEGTSCVEFGDECDNTFNLCCKDAGIPNGICEPGDVPALFIAAAALAILAPRRKPAG